MKGLVGVPPGEPADLCDLPKPTKTGERDAKARELRTSKEELSCLLRW